MHIQSGLPRVEDLLAMPNAVSLSLVISLDGQLCGPDGSSRSISGPEDLDWLRRLRASSDVVLVGAATASAEGYKPIRTRPEFAAVRAAAGLQEHPSLVIVHRTDDVAGLLAQHGPRVLLEAGIRLHTALADYITRIWISHSPTMVGDAGQAFAAQLEDFELKARWCGSAFAISCFERVSPR